GLTVVIALGANLDEALRQHGVILPDQIRTVVNVLVALSAPALAFISSDVLAIELMAGDLRQRQADKDYLEIYEVWQEGLNKSWASQQKQWGVKVEIESPSFPQVSNGNSNGNAGILPAKSTLGFKRKPDATKKVREYFDEHPEALDGN